MVTINRRLTILSGFVFLLMSILAYFVYAGIQNDGGMNAVTLLSPGQVVNGVANGSHHANNVTNVSRMINISALVGSDLFTYDAINSTNFSFWTNGVGGPLALSVIVYNTTVNQTFFTNATVNSQILLTNGYYNLTVNATNASNFIYGNATTKNSYTNLLVDNEPPFIRSAVMNTSNTSNFSGSSGGINFEVDTNDTFLFLDTVSIGFTHTRNVTEFNVSMSRNAGIWIYNLSFTGMGEGVYIARLYSNDSLNNLLSNVSNLTFTIDRTAPNVSVFVTNTSSSNLSNFSTRTNGAIQFNLTTNDSLTLVRNVTIGVTSRANGTQFNMSAFGLTAGQWQGELALGTLGESVYDVRFYVNDSVGNINYSVGNFTFSIDTNAPNVTVLVFNTSNNSALRRGSLQFNVTVNDTITTVQNVFFGFRNDKNASTFNITASVSASVWQATLPLSDLDDGNYTLTSVWSNDSVDNFNNSVGNLSFMLDQSSPNVTFHTNLTTFDTNFSSGGIQFNITANDTMTRVTTIVLGYTNDKNGSQGNISITEPFGGVFNMSFSIAVLMDGIYTMTVYANDTLNNFNGSNANFTFRVDKSAPNITAITLNNYTTSSLNLTATAAANFISLNATVNDTTTTVIGVIFGINSTNASEFNVTPSLTAGRWNATINLTYLTEGEHVVHVYANDSLGNYNSTETFRVVVDRTAPSVSVTCTPSTPTAGETVSCTCTASDGGTGVAGSVSFSGSGSATESTTASGSGTVTSSTCSAVDFAGNRGTGSGSWTVTAASSGGSGGGGSGGGASSGAAGQFEKKTWTSINAGETATLPVDNGAIGVTEVSFGVADTTYGAWVQVRKLESLPSSVATSLPATKVYRNLEFTQQNVEEKLSGLVTIEFKVEKSWLTTNKVGKANVVMYHYDDSAWKELATTLGEDDGTYVHYSAQTPGFSYFAIGQKAAAAEVTPEEGAAAVEEEAALGDEVGPVEEIVPAQEEGAMEDVTGGFNAIWLVPIVVLIVVIGLLVWYWKK